MFNTNFPGLILKDRSPPVVHRLISGGGSLERMRVFVEEGIPQNMSTRGTARNPHHNCLYRSVLKLNENKSFNGELLALHYKC